MIAARLHRRRQPASATAAVSAKRTVIASSSRVKSPAASPASRASPAAARSATSAVAAPFAVIGHRDAHVLARRRAPSPASAESARSAISGVRRDRERGHDVHLRSLLAAEDVAFGARLHRHGDRERRVPLTVSVNVAVNGVGRNGRPNGTSGSKTNARRVGARSWKCAAVSRASAGIVAVRLQLRDAPGAQQPSSVHAAGASKPSTGTATHAARAAIDASRSTCTGWPGDDEAVARDRVEPHVGGEHERLGELRLLLRQAEVDLVARVVGQVHAGERRAQRRARAVRPRRAAARSRRSPPAASALRASATRRGDRDRARAVSAAGGVAPAKAASELRGWCRRRRTDPSRCGRRRRRAPCRAGDRRAMPPGP